jgi:T1SS-143 domain-containing protein
VLEPFAARVSEEGLAGGIADTQGNQDTTDSPYASGKVPVTGVPDATLLAYALLAPVAALSSAGETITWTGEGTSTLTGSAGDTEIIRVTIDADGNYEVLLSGALDHAQPGEGELPIEFGVAVSYAGGPAVNTTLTVTVEDDSPIADAIDGVVANAAGASVSGMLIDTGADIPSDLTFSGTPPAGLTSLGMPVEYAVSGNVLTATAGDETVFTLSANGDGGYDFDLLRPLDLSTYFADFTGKTNAGGPATYAIFDDGSFAILDAENSDTYWVVVSGTSADGTPGEVNPSTPGMGVDNNLLQPGEEILFDFDNEARDGDRNLVYHARIGVQGLTGSEAVSYTVYYADANGNPAGLPLMMSGVVPPDDLLVVDAPNGLYLDKITVQVEGDANNTWIRLTTLETFTRNDSEPVTLDFGFNGTDADGDEVSGAFSITLQNSGDVIADDTGQALGGDPGDNILIGGAGDDILTGGPGDDTLTGGPGSDTFAWDDGDQGTIALPAIDHITDFDMADTAAGGDVLDIGDLLDPAATEDTIANYIGIETDGGDTILNINSGGNIGAGADQRIVLEGIDLTNGGVLDTNAIIADLLDRGKLVID